MSVYFFDFIHRNYHDVFVADLDFYTLARNPLQNNSAGNAAILHEEDIFIILSQYLVCG